MKQSGSWCNRGWWKLTLVGSGLEPVSYLIYDSILSLLTTNFVSHSFDSFLAFFEQSIRGLLQVVGPTGDRIDDRCTLGTSTAHFARPVSQRIVYHVYNFACDKHRKNIIREYYFKARKPNIDNIEKLAKKIRLRRKD